MPKLKTKSSAKKDLDLQLQENKNASSWKETWYDKKNKFSNKKTKRHYDNDKARLKNCKIVYAI